MQRAEPAVGPQALILLANLGRPRRPAGAVVAHSDPILPDVGVASMQLASVTDQPVTSADLADLRRLQASAAAAAEAVLVGEIVDPAVLNALAAGGTAQIELVTTSGVLRQRLIWTDTSMVATLARRLIEELGAFDLGRLRRCARPECDLVFYDATRSRTGRWHAEDPCGWRERQRSHRKSARA